MRSIWSKSYQTLDKSNAQFNIKNLVMRPATLGLSKTIKNPLVVNTSLSKIESSNKRKLDSLQTEETSNSSICSSSSSSYLSSSNDSHCATENHKDKRFKTQEIIDNMLSQYANTDDTNMNDSNNISSNDMICTPVKSSYFENTQSPIVNKVNAEI